MLQRNLVGFVILAVLLPAAVFAQTPDEDTPAEEEVCSGHVGAAFGLCNAYCEAMDCDSSSPNANVVACTRVLDKFANITGQVPPCDATCPCVGQPSWDGFFDGTLAIESCLIQYFDSPGPQYPDYFQIWVNTNPDIFPFDDFAAAVIQTGAGFGVCGSTPSWPVDFFDNRIFGSVGMGETCRGLLEEQVIAAVGLESCLVLDFRTASSSGTESAAAASAGDLAAPMVP